MSIHFKVSVDKTSRKTSNERVFPSYLRGRKHKLCHFMFVHMGHYSLAWVQFEQNKAEWHWSQSGRD